MGYKENQDTATGFVVTSHKDWQTFEKQDYPLKKFEADDIDVAVDVCGVCGSDVHTISGGWGDHPLPLCVGHEVVGRVTRKGDNVKWAKLGQRVGVGAQVYSDMTCQNCKNGDENYCPKQVDAYGAPHYDGTISQGGYSSHVRAHQQFVFPIPDDLDSTIAAPMMCAGLTVFSPLKKLGVGPGKRIAVVGIGGLGHFAILFAVALGAEVWAISTSSSKKGDAEAMGAKGFIAQKEDKDWADKYQFFFDDIICSAKGVDQDLKKFLGTLKPTGRFHNVGMPESALPELHFQDFTSNGSYIGTSHIGNRTEVLEMLDLAAKHPVKSWVQTVPISADGCREVVTRVYNNDNVRYRLVLTDYDKAFGKRE